MEERNMIEDVVKQIRKQYEIPCPILNMDEVAEKLGIRIEESFEYQSPKRIHNSFVISPGLNHKDEKQRNLTIAKDIGHLFLHMRFAEAFGNSSPYQTDEREFHATPKQEQQALDFAYSLLMPEQEYCEIVKRCTNDSSVVFTKRVAGYFHVPFTDARNRGLDLGILEW